MNSRAHPLLRREATPAGSCGSRQLEIHRRSLEGAVHWAIHHRRRGRRPTIDDLRILLR